MRRPRPPARASRRLLGDDGRITLLVLGYFVVIAALLGVVAGIASVQTERQRLFALADAAALDAADDLAEDAYFAGGVGGVGGAEGVVVLTDAGVRASVEAHLASVGAGERFEALTVSALTGTPDGATAQVVLTAVADPATVPVMVSAVTGGVPITVTARARAAVD